uniref:DUF8206 domain-containing protein n=1 Tax=Acrobeloides nanus TaxID=290746 RepID=A0A914BXU7_9BILA
MEYVLEEVLLEHGRMKCRGPSCKKIICHDKCDVTDGTIETFPNAKVKKCKVFKKFKLFKVAKCQVCGCPWDIHIHVIYEARKKLVPVRVEPTQQVKSVDDSIRNIELYIEQYTFEYLTITEAFARFSAFYKKNAILPYNDAFEAYINMEIEDELRLHDGFESLKLKKLTTMLDKYKEEKQMLQGIHIVDVSNIPNETEIFDLCHQIFSLKFTGQQIYRLYHVAMLGKQKHYKQNHEKAYDVQRNDLFKDLYSATKKIFSRAANEPPRNKTQMEDQRQHQRPMQLKLQNIPTGSPEQHVQFNTQNISFPTSLQPTNLKQPIDSLLEPQQVNQENGSHKKKLSPQKSIDSGINISSPMSNSPSPKLPKYNEFSDKKSQKSELEKRFEQLRLKDSNKSDEVGQIMIDKKSSIVPPPEIPPKPKIPPHSPNISSRSSERGPSHVHLVPTSTPPVSTPNDNAPKDPAFPVPKPRRNIPKSPSNNNQ